MTLWIFMFAKRKKEQQHYMTIRIWQSESEPWENDLRSLANKNQVVDTSMFSLVRDYYILSGALIIIFSKNYQVLWEPVCNGRPRNSVCQHTQWWLICTQLMWMLSALQELEELSLLMPTICCCGSCEPAETICPKKSSPDHWCCKDAEIIVPHVLILYKDFAWWAIVERRRVA